MSNKSPKVSVCMRNYNYGHFIGEAIQSVLDQTYGDFEMVIVDDCSTDDSEMVIRNFSDNRIRFYRNDVNVGNVKNLNKCISLASGDYIAILDSDDMFVPTSLEKKVEVLDSNPKVGLIYTSTKLIDKDGAIIEEFRPFAEDHIVSGEEEFKRLILGNYIYWQTVMLRKKDFSELGGFDERILYSSGWEMWLRLALDYHVAYLSEALLLWRQHSEGITDYFCRANQVGMEEYKIVKAIFSNLPPGKMYLSSFEPKAIKALANTMQRRAFKNLCEGRSSLARRNIGLGIAVDDGILKDWKTFALFLASLLGRNARFLKKIPIRLIRKLASAQESPSFFSGS